MGASTTESDSSGNGYHLTTLTDTSVVSGKLGYARFLSGAINQGMWSGAAASAYSGLIGELTVQMWVYLINTASAVYGTLVIFRPNSVSYPTDNPLFQLALTTDSKPALLWYHGAITAVVLVSANPLPLNTWKHLTFVRKLNGSNYDGLIYVDGVLDAQLLNQHPPDGGTSSSSAFAVGTPYPGADVRVHYRGYIDEIRIQKVALSDAQIKADYLAQVGLTEISAPTGHALDGSTYALYRFDDATGATSLADATGNHNSTNVGLSTAAIGKFGSTGLGRKWSRQTKSGATLGIQPSAFAGEFTIECWMLWDGAASGWGSILESRVTSNNLAALYLYMTNQYVSSTTLGFGWMVGSSTYLEVLVDMAAYANKWTHIAARKKVNGLNYDIEFFINGTLAASNLNKTNTDNTGPGTTMIGVTPHTTYFPTGFGGVLDDMRISSVARSDAEILASYQAGIGIYTNTTPTALSPDANTLALWHFNDSTYGSNVSIDTQAASSKGDARVARPLVQGVSAPIQAKPAITDLEQASFNQGLD